VLDHPQLRFRSEIASCQPQVERLSLVANRPAQVESIEKAQADQTSSGAKNTALQLTHSGASRAYLGAQASLPAMPGSAGILACNERR
jgi:hypothetical protein